MAHEKHLIPQKYETPVLIFFIFILLVIFFNKAFLEGKIFVSPERHRTEELSTIDAGSKP